MASRQAKLFYQALDRFSEAAALGRALGLPDLEIKCLRQLALVRFEMGDLALFRETSQRGLELASLVHFKVEQCRFLNNIGVSYQRQLDYSRAIGALERALSMAQAAGDREIEADCLNNLGLVHQETGNADRALFYLSEALARDQAEQAQDAVAMDLANIGSIFCRRGIDQATRPDLVEARDALQKSLAIQEQRSARPPVVFSTLNDLGVVLNELGDYPGARERFTQALQIAESMPEGLERAHALVNIAASYLNEGRPQDAEVYYRASFQAGAAGSLENVLMEACFGLGQCAERSGDPDSALSYYRKSMAAMESVRSRLSEPLMIGFARNKYKVFERVADLLADRAQAGTTEPPAGELYDLFESAKARALLDSLREAHADRSGIVPQGSQDRLRAIARNISELAARLKRGEASPAEARTLKIELEREEEESVRLNLEIRSALKDPPPPWGSDLRPLAEIQKRLADGPSVMLEYLLGERRSYLLRIGPADVRLYHLPARAELERSLRAYLKALSDPSLDPEIVSVAAERVGREVLPAEDGIFRKATNVIVAADGILHALPFEALPVSGGPRPRYLVEDAAVSYVPSASVMAALMDQPRPRSWPKEVLAVGPPPRSRPPLPFGLREVRDIARSYPAGTVDTLVGEDVDESALKERPLAGYRIIHFACHGELDEAFPLRSSLDLSARQGSDDDGLLQAREIYGLKLSAELVVLSACQTGKGRLERSEGPLALARPFFVAGARAVVASLWPLNDRSSAVFMTAFYRDLASGLPASESLRLAKIKMLRSRWAHPFYWAAFVL
ncbi:MAG TPA: CHAT domain-containing tetratricopeptide repeat protein, partial [Candidatus Bathyarchaeia archaeon]|nr:CHAT domain-containing tetratricopeptide repeat protein [Candidatus Bathyarchaeia archaeon]